MNPVFPTSSLTSNGISHYRSTASFVIAPDHIKDTLTSLLSIFSCFTRIALQAMISRRPPVCRKTCALSGCALQSIAFAVQLSSCADRLLLLTSPFLRSRLEYYVFIVKAGSRQLRVLWPRALLHPHQRLPACQSLLLLALVLRLWPLRFSSNRPGMPLLLALEPQYSL